MIFLKLDMRQWRSSICFSAAAEELCAIDKQKLKVEKLLTGDEDILHV